MSSLKSTISSSVEMDRWVGKVAVITGASSGIGKAIAIKLVEAGVQVAAIARREDRLQKLSKELDGKKGRLYAFKADITKEDEVITTFFLVANTLGPIHILINNAGLVLDTTLVDGDANLWKQMIDTNFLGLCVATREAVRNMRKNDVSGHIVHINSIMGHAALPVSNFNVYAGTKFGVTALTEVLRRELISIQSKIKITSISPGAVQTEFSESSQVFRDLFATNPTLNQEDVADAIMYTLGTPPHVQVHELIIKPLGEMF